MKKKIFNRDLRGDGWDEEDIYPVQPVIRNRGFEEHIFGRGITVGTTMANFEPCSCVSGRGNALPKARTRLEG